MYFLILLNKFADGFKPVTFVESSYLDIDMCKFESSQKDESKAQSADSSKAFSKPRALNFYLDRSYYLKPTKGQAQRTCVLPRVDHNQNSASFKKKTGNIGHRQLLQVRTCVLALGWVRTARCEGTAFNRKTLPTRYDASATHGCRASASSSGWPTAVLLYRYVAKPTRSNHISQC